jgi:hypothetical protein
MTENKRLGCIVLLQNKDDGLPNHSYVLFLTSLIFKLNKDDGLRNHSYILFLTSLIFKLRHRLNNTFPNLNKQEDFSAIDKSYEDFSVSYLSFVFNGLNV